MRCFVQGVSRKMAKIENNKYYTPQHIVDLVIQRTKEVIGLDNISEFIEPSAGNGVFLDKLYELGKPVYAYDLYPEREDIKEQDYLKLDLDYKKGRCIIGNPPFGWANSLLKKFYSASIRISDFIVMIMPISQLNNNNELYQFDLIYSEDLGIQCYSNKNIHCCLNIFKIPLDKKYKPNYKLKDLEIIGWRKAKSEVCDYYIICYGSNTGNIFNYPPNNININGIKIHNKIHEEKIIQTLKEAKWQEIYPITTTPNLLQWQIYKYLKEKIIELE